MGWTAEYFWQSTPTEFYLAAETFGESQHSDLKLLAWHAANIMNMLRGRRSRTIKVSDLVKDPKKSVAAPVFANRNEIMEYMRNKKRRKALREFRERPTVH